MKQYLIGAIASVVLFGGCAAHHYHTRSERVTLHIRLPGAKMVSLASSLDNFELHRAWKKNHSTWEISLPGDSEFKYFYVVDGRHYLPDCSLREADDFGSENCIYRPGP